VDLMTKMFVYDPAKRLSVSAPLPPASVPRHHRVHLGSVHGLVLDFAHRAGLQPLMAACVTCSAAAPALAA